MLSFVPVGILCGAVVAFEEVGESWGEFPVFPGAAAFIAPFFIWWVAISRPNKPSLWRGVAVGSVGGLLAHPVCWYLLICWNYFLISLSLRSGPSLGDSPLDPLEGLPAALVFSLLSVVLMGWFTVAVGALIGGILGYRKARLRGPV